MYTEIPRHCLPRCSRRAAPNGKHATLGELSPDGGKQDGDGSHTYVGYTTRAGRLQCLKGVLNGLLAVPSLTDPAPSYPPPALNMVFNVDGNV